MLSFLSKLLFSGQKGGLIGNIGGRLLNKYTSKSIGFFGVFWLIYSASKGVDAEQSQFIAMAISNFDTINIDIAINIIKYVVLFALLVWVLYLAIDNLFRKSINEPTIVMLILLKLFKIEKKEKKNE